MLNGANFDGFLDKQKELIYECNYLVFPIACVLLIPVKNGFKYLIIRDIKHITISPQHIRFY